MQFSETSNWGFSHEMMFTHVFFWRLTGKVSEHLTQQRHFKLASFDRVEGAS